MTDASTLWEEFPLDPRTPGHAGLRAADTDRDRIQTVLAEAFSDGRLDREEHDERLSTLLTTRTLGELPPLVEDLLPPAALVPITVPGATRTPADIEARAQQHWESERRSALFGFLGPTVICFVIWLLSGADVFAWPAIIAAVTGLRMARTLTSREEILARERRRLEKKQAREAREIAPPAPDEPDEPA